MNSSIIYPDESFQIMKACFNIYKSMGNGFTEPVYQECLEIEFEYLKIPYREKPELTLVYRKKTLLHSFIPDYVCFEKIIIELKAITNIANEHWSQILNYLNATRMKLGILVNFGHYSKLEYERFVL
ncbi:MAG: GxxExxY protein [Candidatus Marinimicrobia bacterium]|nr:GxxExxY protein [Candidatus Neomarinimicrobiota bacterium]